MGGMAPLPPVATVLHHFLPLAYAIGLSADLHILKDGTKISLPLRLHMAYSLAFMKLVR